MIDTTLKLKLAELLPEEIKIRHDDVLFWKRFDGESYLDCCWEKIKDTELLEICHRIEKKMDDATFVKYRDKMLAKIPEEKSDLECGRFILSATWQTSAQALIETLKPEKGERVINVEDICKTE